MMARLFADALKCNTISKQEQGVASFSKQPFATHEQPIHTRPDDKIPNAFPRRERAIIVDF
jgi:hypothetical protein